MRRISLFALMWALVFVGGCILDSDEDNTAPSVVLSCLDADTVAGIFTVTITFDEPVSGFVAADLSVTGGTADNLTTTDNIVYTVSVTPNSSPVTVTVPAGVAKDDADNANTAASEAITRYFDGNAPTVTLSSATADTVDSVFSVSITFSEPVSGLLVTEITVSNGTAANLATTDSTVYTVEITPTASPVSVNIGAGVAQDAVANANTAAAVALERVFVQDVNYLIVTTTDYSNGNISKIAVADFSVTTDLLSIYADNAVTGYGGTAYLLERLGADNLIRIDDANVSATGLTYQKSVGAAVNIQEIAVVDSSKAYVTQYASSDIAIINPATGASTGTVSLTGAPYIYEGESVPYMSSAMVVGGNLYVAIQRLKTVQGDWGPTPQFVDSTGMIVVISTATNAIVASITLTKGNPASMDTCEGSLYVSSTGAWTSQTDGGIEKIDLSTNTLVGDVIGEATLGGDITTIELVSATKGYVFVNKFDAAFNFLTTVTEFNPTTGTAGSDITGISNASGMAFDETYLYVADRNAATPGVYVIDPTDNSTEAGSINVGALPPNDLAVVTVKE